MHSENKRSWKWEGRRRGVSLSISLSVLFASIPESVNRCLLIDTINSQQCLSMLWDYKAEFSCELCRQALKNIGVENLGVHAREWTRVSGVSCLNRQSVGTRCHPAAWDTLCPALMPVPHSSSEFKVLIQQRLTHVFSLHMVGKFCLHYNQWELCQCLNKGWVFTLKSAVLPSRYKDNYGSKPRED